MKIKSIIDDNGVPVKKFRILSSSRTRATVSPTLLDSKYFSGSANKCLNSLKLSIKKEQPVKLKSPITTTPVIAIERDFRKCFKPNHLNLFITADKLPC